jgi:hypothetical protein
MPFGSASAAVLFMNGVRAPRTAAAVMVDLKKLLD